LTEDILDLAKMQVGIFALTENTFKMSDILTDISFIFGIQCEKKGLALVIECSDSLRHSDIWSDINRIRQVLLNLISNAFKFTKEGSIKLSVTKVDAFVLRFEVADTGIGISESDSTGLFQMFGMVHKHRDEFNMKGTGLGLTISQKLVERMDGKMLLESEEGKGTTVSFTIKQHCTGSK